MADTNLPLVFPEQIWAGSDLSLSQAAALYAQVWAGVFDNLDEPQDEEPFNYSMQGDIAVISIKGALVNTDHWYNRYREVSSYADIRRAMIYAANDSRAKAVLMDIDSGGGAVSGLFDTAELISKIDKNLKPVYSFTSGTMTSAAYALGVSGREVYNSSTAVLGSIGTITTHMEDSKMLKDMGISVTVMRSGAFKALVNPHEPLTEAAKEQLQQRLDAATGVFEQHVAKQLGTTQGVVHQNMGQGREFFGVAAVDAGLSHGLMSIDEVMSRLNQKLIDNNGSHLNNSVNFPRGSSMKQTLTEQQIAALAAGAPQAASGQQAAAAVTEQASGNEGSAAAATTEAPAATTQAAAAAAPSNDVVAYLQNQLTASQDTAATLRAQLATANAALDATKALVEPLKKIAGQSLGNMRVALNLPKLDTDAMSAETLLADHAATTESFTKAFKTGGAAQAAVATETKKPEAKVLSALEAAQRASVLPKL